MKTLNRHASESMVKIGANACTDVTGFGLLGHLKEMMDSSNKTAVVNFNKIPILEGVFPLIKEGMIPGGTLNNLDAVSQNIIFDTLIENDKKILLADAQTSGGLIISLETSKVPELLTTINKDSFYEAVIIGNVIPRESNTISIKVSL
jgi:selenide,water dikinase